MDEQKRLKVYCETSFWSYLTGRPTKDEKVARDQALTLKWWDEVAPLCDIYISQHVTTESADGGPQFAARRLEVLWPWPDNQFKIVNCIWKGTGRTNDVHAG